MNVEAAILAGTFVGCAIATVSFAAILVGMFPTLSCPSCKKASRDNDHDDESDPWHNDWICGLACQWFCMRFCNCCRPLKLREQLIESVAELERAERKQREEREAEEEKSKTEKL